MSGVRRDVTKSVNSSYPEGFTRWRVHVNNASAIDSGFVAWIIRTNATVR